MKYCSQCGKALADDAKFCSGCGKSLAPVEPMKEPVEPVKEPVEPVKDDTSFINVPPIDDTPPVVAPAVDTAVEPADDTVVDPVPPAKKTLLQKIKAFTWKAWLIVAAAVIALGVGTWFLVDALTNNYETPVKNYVELRNAKKHSWDMYSKLFNGFASKEISTIMDVFKKTDYADYVEQSWESIIKNTTGYAGSDYKVSYKIEDKDKLDEDDLEEFEEKLNSIGKSMLESVEEEKDSDWDELAESAGVSTSQFKKLYNATKDFGKILKKAKVTEGYELTVTITINGSELDEPKEQEMTMYVYKVDGRWISQQAFDYFPML